MNFLHKAGRAFDKVMSAMLLLSGVIIIIDVALVTQDVIIRKTVDFTWAPLYEILTYSLVWMSFLGTAAIYRDDGHVKLDSFLQFLPQRSRTLVNFITSCAIVVLCLFMCFLTARLTVRDYLNDFVLASILNPPKWPIEVIIPIALFMLAVQAVRHAVRYYQAFRSPETAQPASPQPAPQPPASPQAAEPVGTADE